MTTHRDRVRALYREERAKNVRADQALSHARYEAKYSGRSKKLDILPSRYSAYDGEEITELPNGWKIKVEFQHDQDSGPPWENCDGMGVVTDWQSRDDDDLEDWVLCSERRSSSRYFDWRATLPIAIKEGWDATPYGVGTKRDQAMRAMRSTYEYLHRWCNDEWWYVGMIVTLLDEDDNDLAEDSCWGYESDSIDYLCSEARSWAAGMIRAERKARREAAKQERIEHRFHDAMENAL